MRGCQTAGGWGSREGAQLQKDGVDMDTCLDYGTLRGS